MSKLDPTLVMFKDVSLQHLLDNAVDNREEFNESLNQEDVSNLIEPLIYGFPMGVFIGSFLTEDEQKENPGKLYEIHTIGDYRLQYIRWFVKGDTKLVNTTNPLDVDKTITTLNPTQRKNLLDRRVSLVLLDASLTVASDFDGYQDILLDLYAN